MSITLLAAATLGIHLGSAHLPAKPDQNNLNLGVYLRDDASGWEVGAYFNTYERPTLYVGKHWDLGHGVTFVLGGATGYERSCTEAPDRVTTRTETTVTPSGIIATKTTTTRAKMKTCIGSSDWPIAPMAGFTWAPRGPVAEGLGKPRVWFTPALGKDSSSLVHLSWEW